jgi:hypothetical protein
MNEFKLKNLIINKFFYKNIYVLWDVRNINNKWYLSIIVIRIKILIVQVYESNKHFIKVLLMMLSRQVKNQKTKYRVTNKGFSLNIQMGTFKLIKLNHNQ